ncbi:37S ribosomal protein MRP2 [Escovopsis weberi]|uniref:37S ribosomal protein MRP2 n=1 Tax=Escovopsis weberi TaxID=150374 RepID=A0A0M8MYI7_ESCWE|nr:37S ribosomal protein MRP2 [Escovopsis weberi]
MSMFRAKKLDLGCFVKARTIRDHTKRKVFEEHETERQALRYLSQNTTLPPRVRVAAQLQLSQMHCYTRPTQIRNRCIMGGQGRGVLRAFKMTRVRSPFSFPGIGLPGLTVWPV